jgi:hypothetical protein
MLDHFFTIISSHHFLTVNAAGPRHQSVRGRHWKIGFVSTGAAKEYEILRSPGSEVSLLNTGQVYNYCAMRGNCLLNRAISPTFLPLYPWHSRFHQIYFTPSSPLDIVDSTRCTVFSSCGSRVIFNRTAALNSDHGPVLGRLVRCLGFLVLYILWEQLTIS